ncbi:MAG: Gfo/Idh/MocA family oxidoreductase [Kiritimatiellae bacterium]|nr:Gfo/Idh/MocA family oxidoreductase [Kiritimatiellia bacterium]
MNRAPPISRRKFLRAAVVLPFAATATAPSERIGIALIGCGLMGTGHLRHLLGRGDVQLIAVCDPDRVRREAARQIAENADSGTGRGCVALNDYRDALSRSDVDAVVIVTPDHWHAIIAADAARARKDIYCEKPVSLVLAQGRRLADVVHARGVVFQTGTQYRSKPVIRRICQFVRTGGLGRVRQVFTLWTRVNGLPYPHNPALPAEPVPEGLDWDMWIGPAPWRPYSSRYHRNPPPGVVPWHFCSDFGVGAVTAHHSHSADIIQYALGMERSGPVEILHPADRAFPTITCRYANGTLLHMVENWSDVARLYHAVPADADLRGMFGGVFVGERGWITSMSGAPIRGGPADLLEEAGLLDVQVGDFQDHHDDWIHAIRSRGPTRTDAELGHRAAALGHLIILALRLGRSLRWDPLREEFPGDEEANRLRDVALRPPWRL